MHKSLVVPVAVIMGIHSLLLVRLKLAFVVVMQPSRALVRLLCMLLGLGLGKKERKKERTTTPLSRGVDLRERRP